MGYDYTLEVEGLHMLNMEAQGELLSDYYVLLTSPPGIRYGATRSMRGNTLKMYQAFLAGFIDEPFDRRHLPATTKTMVLADE